MGGRTGLGRVAAALLATAAVALAHAQPQPPTTEAQARYWVYGAFLTQAVPEIIGERVTLGPELQQRLGVPADADRARVYGALMAYTDGKPLNVRKATAEEIARYQPQAKRELKAPVFAVLAGDIALLVEYDLQANTIPFVGQLGVAYQPPTTAPGAAPVSPTAAPGAVPVSPTAAPRVAPAASVATIAPKRAPARAPRAPSVEALKPNGPCVVNPVMSEQDLVNCRVAPSGSARVQPTLPAPAVVAPQARAVPPPPPSPQRAAPCEVKPVMTEEDLANCRNASGGAARVQPGPPVVVKPQARVEATAQPRRAAPCEIKPVMTEEDLANCRNASGGAARVQPGPPIVVKPQARVEAVSPPQRAAPCEVKPVMTEEDLANCRNAPAGAARVQAGPPVTARPVAASEPPRKPAATPCIVKPVMSEEDLIACGTRPR